MFWKEQKKAFEDNKNVSKYHPMIIRFCLSLAAKSPSAYEELRDSKILQLPSKRTPRDYRNAIKPTAGFNKDVINELAIAASNLSGHHRYLTVAFDEMKIKESLVFNKNSNELVGYVDIGDPELNYGTFEDTNQLATHAFTYYIRGISSDLKFSLAYFATNGMSSYQIMSTFWEAVGILELTCNLHVIAAVSDGALSNRKFYNNHRDMDGIGPNNDIVHRTVNIYAPKKHIWFFAGAPHLLKAVRNSIYNSGVGKARNMRNDGRSIIWAHLWTLVTDDLNLGVRGDSKLTFEHVNLNPYSKMNVNLAAQILSKTVSVLLKMHYLEETHATTDLFGIMNDFFDCLNGRCQNEGFFKRNVMLAPFRHVTDSRYEWLQNVFIQYLEKWKVSIDSREGFTNGEKNRIFLAPQTYEVLKITAYSTIEATRYLLNDGMP